MTYREQLRTIHANASPLAGATVTIKDGVRDDIQNAVVPGATFVVIDWFDRLGQGSWMTAENNIAAGFYSVRSWQNGLPLDDEVLYGKINNLGYCIHITEVEQ